MSTEKQLKLSMLISIIGIIAVVAGVSFAIFNRVVNSSNRQVIKSGAIKLTLTESDTGLDLSNSSEMTDEQGFLQSSYYEFSINNTGDDKAYYAIKLIDDTTANETYGGTVLDDKYIKVGVTKNDVNQAVVNLEDALRIVSEGVINESATDNYKVRLWLDFTGLSPAEKEALLLQQAYFKIKIESEQISDITRPVCNFTSVPSVESLDEGETGTYVLECTSSGIIRDGIILTSDITVNGGDNLLSITNIATTTIENGFRYTIIATGGSGDGVATITLTANSVIDKFFNGNLAVTSNDVVIGEGILNLDESGANEPDLATGMIPVYYDSTNDVWKKADSTNNDSNYQWYSYSSSGVTKGMWANAVTVNVSNDTIKDKYFNSDMSIKVANGTEISMSEINTMWVWIPRFSAVTPSNYNGGTALAPGAIDVTFVNTSTVALDGFWWDEDSDGIADAGEQKSGFWYGKFETSSDITCTAANYSAVGSGCNLTTIKPKIIPNVTSWRGAQVVTYFNASRNMKDSNNMYGFVANEADTHMSKNNEWGVVAYLTQSIYGRCSNSTTCDEVTVNNCNTYKTGIGGDTVSAGESSTTCTTSINQYNWGKGVLASTTGTIYGIYDMSGGSLEYVMGNYNNMSGHSIADNLHSGFNGTMYTGNPLTTGISFPESKYVNVYTGTSYTGHALSETAGWYSDYISFVYSYYPWFICGGYWKDGSNSGVFYHNTNTGNASQYNSFRCVIVK